MNVLGDRELAAVARLWNRSGRELITSFNGVSMLPTIAPGQRVRIRCTNDLAPGDVAAFLQGETVIVHRLVARSTPGRRPWWLFRGDANALCDIPVLLAEQIIGKIEAVEFNGEFMPAGKKPGSLRARAMTAMAIAVLRVNVRLGFTLLRFTIALRRAVFAAIARSGTAR